MISKQMYRNIENVQYLFNTSIIRYSIIYIYT